MINCEMCGQETKDAFMRWYEYDNGEIERMSVCRKCQITHETSLKGQFK